MARAAIMGAGPVDNTMPNSMPNSNPQPSQMLNGNMVGLEYQQANDQSQLVGAENPEVFLFFVFYLIFFFAIKQVAITL